MPLSVLWSVYLVFTALMTIFGWLLYRRRHIEVAGEVIVHRPIKVAFRYLAGLFSGVIFSFILMMFTIGGQVNSLSTLTVWLTVSTIIFGVLGFLIAEMLIQKRLRVLKTAYKGIIVFVLSVVAVVVFIRLDGTGFERRVPDQNDVASVSVTNANMNYISIHGLDRGFNQSGNNWNLTWSYMEHQRTHGLPIFDETILQEIKLRTPVYFESPEAIAAAIKLHQAIVDNGRNVYGIYDDFEIAYGYQSYTITYTLKDGRILSRVYSLPIFLTDENNLLELLLDLYNQPEALDKRNRIIELPESSILGAVLTPTSYDPWLADAHYESRMYQGEKIFLEEDLSAIMEALREDAANGDLGRVYLADLHSGYIHDDVVTLGVIDFLVDFQTAGVPSVFEPDHLFFKYWEPSGFGLVLSVTINESHVNTVRVLEELGVLTNNKQNETAAR
jgi:hypothetical protein